MKNIKSLKLKDFKDKDKNKIKIQEYSIEYNKKKIEEEIAIIGMDCRFPKSNNIEEYWENLKNGNNCIGKFPLTRRKDTDHLIKNKYNSDNDPYQIQGYLEEIDKFDPIFFNITPDEANKMDPSQRLFLETVWGALEDAALSSDQLKETKTGVYVGKAHFCEPIYKDFIKNVDMLSWTGSITGMLASRISYFLNLRGPAIVIDTACSSSLTAIHLACQSLKSGDCDIAIVGGINIFLLPLKENKLMMEAPDYVLRPFDKYSKGTVWGEGVGVVILKPLKKAIEDNDHIYGIIKGSALNNDGASNGITAPNPEAQEKLLVELWKKLDINPETFSYYEAHGTGTSLGDSIEIHSITRAFSKFTNKKKLCPIGTVKSNIGHLAAASGIASLIKCLLILKHKEIPPTINYSEPNPYINFSDAPVYVNIKLKKIENNNSPIRIGINSFGISGTNCHLVLEEAPEIKKDKNKIKQNNFIFTLSVKKESLIKNYISKFLNFISKNDNIDIADLCYTTNIGKDHYNYRLALIVKDIKDLKEKLIKIYNSKDMSSLNESGIYYGYHRIVLKPEYAGKNGKITKEEKDQIDKNTSEKINEFIKSNRVENKLLEEIAIYYIKGANIWWELLYDKDTVKKISVPYYPFQRRRCWID